MTADGACVRHTGGTGIVEDNGGGMHVGPGTTAGWASGKAIRLSARSIEVACSSGEDGIWTTADCCAGGANPSRN